jgi:hypothetical protein
MLSYFYKFLAVLIMLAPLLSSCATSRVTYSNYLKIEKGMDEQEVIQILGEPTKVTSGKIDAGAIGSLFGLDNLSGTTMTWITDEAKANIIFFEGKVKTMGFTN